jgi:hypothetical protein
MNRDGVASKNSYSAGSRDSAKAEDDADLIYKVKREIENGEKTKEVSIQVQKCRYSHTGTVNCIADDERGIITEVKEISLPNYYN